MTFAYVTYDWATTIDPSTTTSKKAHDGLSVSELKDVTEVYKNKEIESEGLLRTPPHAPEYRKVRVVALQPDIVSASTTQINSSSSVSR